jgi:hypothetical protein
MLFTACLTVPTVLQTNQKIASGKNIVSKTSRMRKAGAALAA